MPTLQLVCGGRLQMFSLLKRKYFEPQPEFNWIWHTFPCTAKFSWLTHLWHLSDFNFFLFHRLYCTPSSPGFFPSVGDGEMGLFWLNSIIMSWLVITQTLKQQFQLVNQELYVHERIWPRSKLSLPCSLLQWPYCPDCPGWGRNITKSDAKDLFDLYVVFIANQKRCFTPSPTGCLCISRS